MLQQMHRIFVWLVLIGLLSPVALASTEFEKQLDRADAMRSSDQEQFNRLLIQLDKSSAGATADQLERLRYLHAYRLAYSGQYNLAIQKASSIFEQAENPTIKYRAGLLVINSTALTRDFVSGFTFLDKTLLLQGKISDRQLRHDGLIVASVLYNQVGQHELGKHYAEEVLADSPAPRARCFANNLLLESYYHLKSLPENDADIHTMIATCSEQGEVLAANMSRIYLAKKWLADGETKKAVAFLEDHLTEAESTKYPKLISEVHSLLAQYKFRSNELALAEHHANIAVKASVSIPYSPSLAVAEKTLYEIGLRRNDTAMAFEHFRKYAEADKAYLNDVKAKELAFQLVKHETQQKTQTIDLLNKKNEVLQLEQTVAKQKAHYTAILVGLLVILLAMLLLWAYRTKRMQMAFRRLAETDALTGISNRDHFTKLAEQAISDASKKSESLGMIMFDLDNFKSINDRFGHSTGDWVLKQVIAACKPICRKQDCFGRIGGEEFAILLHASDLSSASEMADRFRKHIAAIDTGETGHDFKVTASFGVTTTPLSGYFFDALLSNADQALYQSKREGRNRVSTFDKLKSGADIADEAAIGL